LFEGELSGSFNQVTLPALSNGLSWDTSHLDATGTISVTPEPDSLVLLAAGAVGLFGYGLRRRAARRTARIEAQDDSPAVFSVRWHVSRQPHLARCAA
jgi:hypothetical protein